CFNSGRKACRKSRPFAHEKARTRRALHVEFDFKRMAERTGLEPATSGVTGQHSNQLNYRSVVQKPKRKNRNAIVQHSSAVRQMRDHSLHFVRSGVPTGIRTPVATVKGWCPRPLDDGDSGEWWSQPGSNRRPLQCHCSALPAELWPHAGTGKNIGALKVRQGIPLHFGVSEIESRTLQLSS